MQVLPLALVDDLLVVGPFLAVLVVFVVVGRLVTIVDDDERVVLFEDGEVDVVLGPGVHLPTALLGHTRTVGLEPLTFELAEGRAESEDGVAVVADASGTIEATDAAAVAAATGQYPGDVQHRIAEAFVTQVGYLPWTDLDGGEETLAEACRRELRPELAEWGVDLLAFEVERLERTGSNDG